MPGFSLNPDLYYRMAVIDQLRPEGACYLELRSQDHDDAGRDESFATGVMMKITMPYYCAAALITGKVLFATIFLSTLLSTLLGCMTVEQKRAKLAQDDAYQVALSRGINAHVYEMSCQAVLPVAEEILIKRGYATSVYDQEGLMVEMQWKEDANSEKSRYIAQGMALGDQRCNLQIVAEKDVAGQRSAHRSDDIEMELLNRLKPEIAKDIKAQAKSLSEQVYQETLQHESQDLQNVREVNDEREHDNVPEKL